MSGGTEPEDVDLVAAEYVLGTLDAAERASFAERLRSDGGAKRSVTQWEARFSSLANHVDTVTPPASLWDAIERALKAPPAKPRTFKVIDGGGLIADRSPTLEASRNRWRAAAVALGGIAAMLVAFVAVDRAHLLTAPETSGDRYVAAVVRGGDKPALLVRVDFAKRRVYVMPVAAEAPSGHSLELWYIGDDKSPRPMGIVEQRPATIDMPANATAVDATFAVSVEPPGGSPTGGPTGPVVYSGQLIRE